MQSTLNNANKSNFILRKHFVSAGNTQYRHREHADSGYVWEANEHFFFDRFKLNGRLWYVSVAFLLLFCIFSVIRGFTFFLYIFTFLPYPVVARIMAEYSFFIFIYSSYTERVMTGILIAHIFTYKMENEIHICVAEGVSRDWERLSMYGLVCVCTKGNRSITFWYPWISCGDFVRIDKKTVSVVARRRHHHRQQGQDLPFLLLWLTHALTFALYG